MKKSFLSGWLMLLLPVVLLAGPRTVARPDDDAGPRRPVVRPFTLDHNRMMVEVEFRKPDGSLRTAVAWVDTGSQHLSLGENLARDLGYALAALEKEANSRSIQLEGPAPRMSFGGLVLDTSRLKVQVHRGKMVRPGVLAEATFPASVLLGRQVIFDYPARQMTVAPPGLLTPKGTAIPCRINPETGLFLITAELDGQNVQLGVDNGSAGTWVSKVLTGQWQARHPEWPRAAGAAGSANFFGFEFETQGVLMCLPRLKIGPLEARRVTVLGLDQGLFDWYSKKSAGPVAGFIGANVLTGFRLEIDFVNQITYWEAGPGEPAGDLERVGITLRAEEEGRFTVAGVLVKDEKPLVEGLLAGDRLLQVDNLECTGAAMGAVMDALRGQPGQTRSLLIERSGERHTVLARVVRLP